MGSGSIHGPAQYGLDRSRYSSQLIELKVQDIGCYFTNQNLMWEQEAIGRLGSAMLEPNPICPAGRSPRQHFPDLIPCDSNQSTQRTRSSSANILPQPGSPSRQVLLETVKEALEKRQKPVRYQEEDVCPSPRVGFYQFRHETSHDQDKLSRLSVQKLGSVTIAEPTGRDRPLNHVISVQSPSILPVRSPTRQLLSQPADTSGNERLDDMKPDDVARLVSDILATQMELAIDSLGPAAGCSTEDSPYQVKIRVMNIK